MRSLFVLVLGILAAMPAWAGMDRSALIAISASVLKIEALRIQGGMSVGSGVVVAPEKIVTNCHVTRDALKLNVLRGGLRWPVDSQLSDIDRDLCLLHVPGLQAPPVAMGRTDRMTPGQAVTALGFTGGMGLQNSEGEVLALHRVDGGRVIRSSNWFSSGASGGGLFDEDLRLVGILTFRLRGGESHYFAAPVEWLAMLLKSPEQPPNKGLTPAPAWRLAYWQRSFAEQPRFLKAALLQRDEQWPQLRSLAHEWAREDPLDPEPWHLMGQALAQMDRLSEARVAFECSRAIESGLAAEWDRQQTFHDHRDRAEDEPPTANAWPSSVTTTGEIAPCIIGAPWSWTP